MPVTVRRGLELVALQLAGVVAAIHLWWGLERFVERYLLYGYLRDPRPFLFVVTTMGIIAGVTYVVLGGRRKPVYLAGIGLFVAFLSGYFWWHLTGHGGVLPGIEGYGHYGADSHSHSHSHTPDAGSIFRRMVTQHAREYPIIMVSKVAEALGILVLSALFWLEHTDPQLEAAAEERSTPATDPADD
jgi:hypothetical protein